MTPSIFLVSSIYLRSMKIPNREFSHQPYKATSVVTSHGQLDHFTCICRSNMCGCGYICHMMQARTKPRSAMMNNLNQKHHHTTTVTCVCLVYNTQTQSLSDPGWQSLQASNTWRQLNVMPSTITPELMFECIHPWKLPNKAWWQAMLTPSFFCHVRSCQQCAMSAHAICTCVTTSGDRIDEIKWENKCFHFTEGHSSRKLFIFSSAKQVCRDGKSCDSWNPFHLPTTILVSQDAVVVALHALGSYTWNTGQNCQQKQMQSPPHAQSHSWISRPGSFSMSSVSAYLFFSETAMFKCLHTSLAEGLPSWELPSCKVSISAFNHASRASERWRCSSARTWLIYLEIIDDPAEAAEAEEAMASKENRIHTKTSTWISPKRWWVSLTMSCKS